MAAAKKTEIALETQPEEKQLPRLGDVVYYYKEVQTGGGKEVKQFAAVVVDYPVKGSNFQKKDMALDLKVLTCARGGADEVKHGVIYAETKTAQRWSFRD